MDAQQHASSSGASYEEQTHAGGGDAGFFERERNRLIQDISKGVESILGNSNALNRKIEESISVGKEFHPISELWSKFEKVMVASGIPNLHPQGSDAGAGSGGAGTGTAGGAASIGDVQGKENVTPGKPLQSAKATAAAGEEVDQEALRFDLGGATAGTTGLPPGVAPGGGRIYA